MLYTYEIEALWTTDTSKHGKHEGYVVAESLYDAHYMLEDAFSLKLDVDLDVLSIRIYDDGKLLMTNGIEVTDEHREEIEKIKRI